MFTRSETTWTQQAKLTAADAAGGGQFGYSVAVSGNTAVVGARLDDEAGFHSGSAYVFTRSGTTWTQQAKLTADDGTANDFFGSSVSISGNTAVVGAPFDDHAAGLDAGSAYVFVPSDTTWIQEAKVSADDAAEGDYFGYSVAVSGDTAVVGAPRDDDAGPDSGSAYVFTSSDATWPQQAKLSADTADGDDRFGSSVAVSGETAVVGAPFDDDDGSAAGSASVFTRSGTTWTQEATLIASDSAEDDNFGYSVAVSNDTAVVGAPLDEEAGYATGSAYVFTRGDTTWSQQAKLTAADAAEGDGFGTSVAVSGDTAVVGAPFDDDDGSASGSAHVFVPSTVPSGTVETVDDTVVSNGARGRVTGTISCEAGEVFLLHLSLIQGDTTGQGRTRGTCTGSPQAFDIGFFASGGTFSDGPARACVAATTAVAGSRSSTSGGEVCEEVTVEV